MPVVELKDANFEEEVTQTDKPVIVDFWAEWCAPCRRLGPVIEELAEDYEGRVKVGKLNIDQSASTAQTFGVLSIPTVIYFENGKEVRRVVGAREKSEFELEFGLSETSAADE